MNETAAIEGTWQIVSAELAGEKMPDLVTHKIEVELGDGAYAVRFGGEVADRGTYELGPHPAAWAITLTGVVGTNAGRTIPAIYQFVGEQLHICYGLDGAAPDAFATQPGAALFLAIYRRKDSSRAGL
jgi:uncharacterized protein (TIGR03067 family)